MILQVLTNIETYLIEEDKRMIEKDKHCKCIFYAFLQLILSVKILNDSFSSLVNSF